MKSILKNSNQNIQNNVEYELDNKHKKYFDNFDNFDNFDTDDFEEDEFNFNDEFNDLDLNLNNVNYDFSKKSDSSDSDLDLDFNSSKSYINLDEWWLNSDKITIIDNKTKDVFKVAIECSNKFDGYNLYQKNKQLVGKMTKWIDIKNEIPNEFKHKNVVVNPNISGMPLYIYELFEDSSTYHELPKNIYTKFKYDSEYNVLKITNEILD